MALAQIGGTTFDPGSWLTNLFLKVPSDPQIAEILRELMRNKGIDFTEVSR
jgi:NADPH-dependent 2,4-dienoyl-CoA reductase/sulfur reductase-like enzyme